MDTPPPISPHQEALWAEMMGAHFVKAMMRSASPDKIPPQEWWTRAKSAFIAGLEKGESPYAVASEMARKLQIELPSVETFNSISSLGVLNDPEAFSAWRARCLACAEMIVAYARALRAEERENAAQR